MLLTPPLTRAGQVGFDPTRRFEEGDGVIVVLLDPGRDREDVGIENDVVRREAGALSQQPVGARADLGFALQCVGLATFVESHHDDRGAITPNESCLAEKFFLARFERDGIDDALALDAFQAGFDHAPFRAVDHDRQPGDIGFAPDQSAESASWPLRVDHSLVHVDVENVRPALDLMARHNERAFEIFCQDQLRKFRRTGDVGPFADDDEAEVGRDVERFEAG